MVKALEALKVCRVRYRRLMAEEAKEFYIKPLKLFPQGHALLNAFDLVMTDMTI